MAQVIAAAPEQAYAEHRSYLLALGILFAIVWTTLAIDPGIAETGRWKTPWCWRSWSASRSRIRS